MARGLNNTQSPARAVGLNLNDPNELFIMIVIIVGSVFCGAPCLYCCVCIIINGIRADAGTEPGRYQLATQQPANPKIIQEYVKPVHVKTRNVAIFLLLKNAR